MSCYCYVKDQHRQTWHAAALELGAAYRPALCGEPAPGGHWTVIARPRPTDGVLCPACRDRAGARGTAP